ncbi:MarR family transcriptional regulator [Kribbella soli]|uniref:MarR family transcriptional regulator n=1 Tax=Kribbella soli TaxID=1124743 RepID=UPI0013F47F77|nr:helix-turn-helix domain-containing protein [Kribbella soli]
MTFADDDRLQSLSKTLFGQRHRLAVMLAVARGDGVINPSDLTEQLGFRAQSSVQAPLRDLASAGLITRVPTSSGKTYYRRNSSLAWAWAEEIALAARDVPSSDRASAEPDVR